MDQRKQIALGTFILVVLALLAYATLFLTDFRMFRESHAMVVSFHEANGLRSGDSVLVAGIRKGRVTQLAYDPTAVIERRVTVTLALDEEVVLREGFRIEIEDATLLGGRQIAIGPGPPESAEVPQGTTLFGNVAGNALAGISRLIEDNREAFDTILDNVTAFTTDLREGRGTLARLASDAALADQVSNAVARFVDPFGAPSLPEVLAPLAEAGPKVQLAVDAQGRLLVARDTRLERWSVLPAGGVEIDFLADLDAAPADLDADADGTLYALLDTELDVLDGQGQVVAVIEAGQVGLPAKVPFERLQGLGVDGDGNLRLSDDPLADDPALGAVALRTFALDVQSP